MVHTTREATSELLASDTGSEPFVFGPNQTKWLEMLESGQYRQCRGQLQEDETFCCLGVGLLAIDRRYCNGGSEFTLDDENREELGLWHDDGGAENHDERANLSVLNDDGKSFKEIAAEIRANPRVYFKESR